MKLFDKVGDADTECGEQGEEHWVTTRVWTATRAVYLYVAGSTLVAGHLRLQSEAAEHLPPMYVLYGSPVVDHCHIRVHALFYHSELIHLKVETYTCIIYMYSYIY